MFSGFIGSSLSFFIRMELSSGSKVYLLDDQYNVIVTAHAIVMIFLCAYVLLFCLLPCQESGLVQCSVKIVTYPKGKPEGDHSMSL